MTSERWADVERLYHAALAQDRRARTVFLAEACAGDDALRREVESLLAQEAGAAGFMSTPAVALAGAIRKAAPRRSSVSAWGRIRSSRCWARAGWARSTGRATRSSGATSRSRSCRRLFTSDPDRLARFEREARCSRRSIIRTSARSTASRTRTASGAGAGAGRGRDARRAA